MFFVCSRAHAQWNNQGSEALKVGNIDEAIACFTKAIAISPNTATYYSSRSAVLLQKGDAANALKDAESCLRLDPNSAIGHVQKGDALCAMKQYDDAIGVYTHAIQKFPDKARSLSEKLTKTQLSRDSVASNFLPLHSSQASMIAFMNKHKQAMQADGLSDFNLSAKFALELQIHALQNQLDLVNSLGQKTDEQKMQILFQLVDKDEDNAVDARDLADALRKRNSALNFGQSIDRAISFVAAFDEDKDAMLSFTEFKAFILSFTDSLGVTFDEIAEFLILQNLFSQTGFGKEEDDEAARVEADINQAVKEQETVFDSMADPRMAAIFNLFDKDGSGNCDFQEVAVGLFRLTNDMEEAVKTAVSVLLTIEQEESRTIDYEQFSRLILSFVAATGLHFEDAADNMTLAMMREPQVSEEDVDMLRAGQEIYEDTVAMQELEQEASEVTNALQYGRLQKLYDLWNTAADEGISFEELMAGLRKFQAATGIDECAQQTATILIGFDEDGDQKLNRAEFANAMIKYAKAIKADLHVLVNFMCVVSVMDSTCPMGEAALLQAVSPKTAKKGTNAAQEMAE